MVGVGSWDVAQTGSLLYRGLAIRGSYKLGESADYQSATQQVTNLRYGQYCERASMLGIPCMHHFAEFVAVAVGTHMTGINVIPHLGHLPGLSECTSLCSGIGQV